MNRILTWIMVGAGLVGLLSACQADMITPAPAATATATAPNVIRVGVDENWPPFQYLGPDGNPTGIDVELISAILKRAGFAMEFSAYPWKRLMVSVESGAVDLAMGTPKTPEDEVYGYFSDTYFRLGHNFLYIRAADQEKYRSIKSLRDLIGTDFRLGVQIGVEYSPEYAELLKDAEFKKLLSEVSDDTSNIEKLMHGRIDGFLTGEYGGAFRIKNAGYEGQIVPLVPLNNEDEAIQSSAGYLIFSKKTMTLEQVARINAALEEMKADGSYQAILEKYQVGKLGVTQPDTGAPAHTQTATPVATTGAGD